MENTTGQNTRCVPRVEKAFRSNLKRNINKMKTTVEDRLKALEDLREEFPGDMKLSDVFDKVIEQYEREENGQKTVLRN